MSRKKSRIEIKEAALLIKKIFFRFSLINKKNEIVLYTFFLQVYIRKCALKQSRNALTNVNLFAHRPSLRVVHPSKSFK